MSASHPIPLAPNALVYTVSNHDRDRLNPLTGRWSRAGRVQRVTVYATVNGRLIELAHEETEL